MGIDVRVAQRVDEEEDDDDTATGGAGWLIAGVSRAAWLPWVWRWASGGSVGAAEGGLRERWTGKQREGPERG